MNALWCNLDNIKSSTWHILDILLGVYKERSAYCFRTESLAELNLCPNSRGAPEDGGETSLVYLWESMKSHPSGCCSQSRKQYRSSRKKTKKKKKKCVCRTWYFHVGVCVSELLKSLDNRTRIQRFSSGNHSLIIVKKETSPLDNH